MATTYNEQIPLARRVWAHIELADPVTWMSPSLVALCGALASGRTEGFNPSSMRDWAVVALLALMTGPLGTGFSQSINDYYDRDLDAINDPSRPIPSGRVTLAGARANWIFLAVATFVVSFAFGNPFVTILAMFGLILSAIYSVPPIKLKKSFWLGPPAVGFGYVSMSWIAGHIIFADLTWQSVIIAFINGGLASGMLFLNDIKSVEGDRFHGLKSITVTLGVKRALLAAYVVVNGFELMLMALVYMWGHTWVAAFLLLALLVPIYSQIKLYQEPSHKNYIRLILTSNPFLLLIQFVSAFVAGGYFA